MFMTTIMGLALCGSMIFIYKQNRSIKQLRRYRLIKDMTEYTSENMNITKSIRNVNTVLLDQLHRHLSDSTIFLKTGDSKLSVMDSTIDEASYERQIGKIIDFEHPQGVDFRESFEEAVIQVVEEKNEVSLLYPTAEERGIKSAVLVPLQTSGQVIGYWFIEHTKSLTTLDIKEVTILSRHLAMTLASGLIFFNDPLMGIAKRRFVEEAIEDQIQNKSPFCVVFADIDHFKQVNDTYGHDIGDEVLKIIAQVLKENVRDKDVIGRYGGEELVLCLPEIEMEKAVERLNEIRTQIACLQLDIEGKPLLTVTCSFGVVSSKEMETLSVDALLKVADDRVYQAKENGRNRVEWQ